MLPQPAGAPPGVPLQPLRVQADTVGEDSLLVSLPLPLPLPLLLQGVPWRPRNKEVEEAHAGEAEEKAP